MVLKDWFKNAQRPRPEEPKIEAKGRKQSIVFEDRVAIIFSIVSAGQRYKLLYSGVWKKPICGKKPCKKVQNRQKSKNSKIIHTCFR